MNGDPCNIHPEKHIRWACDRCSKPLCEDCDPVSLLSKIYCSTCAQKESGENPPASPQKLRWLNFLRHPKKEIQQALLYNLEDQKIERIAMLGGISLIITRMGGGNLSKSPLWGIIFLCLIFGPAIGWFIMEIESRLLKWTGDWLGGKASLQQLQAVYAWSNIPLIFGLAILTPRLLYIHHLFNQTSRGIYPYQYRIVVFLGILAIGLHIWSFFSLLIGVKETQKFSTGKVWANVLLAYGVLLLIYLLPLLLLLGGAFMGKNL